MYFLRRTVATLGLLSLGVQDCSAFGCYINNLPKRDGVCVGQINCERVLTNLFLILTQWDCIRPATDIYRLYDRLPIDDNYDLNVNIVNVEYDSEISVFGYNNYKLNHIKKIALRFGNLVSVPEEIYKLTEATEVEISHNVIEEIKLDNFLSLSMLNKINVSHNSITVIRTGEEVKQSAGPRAITTIDLSYNFIETLPINCFVNFRQLQHLNLSNNSLGNFDISTFADVQILQSLHLSNNKITEIGNTLERLINLQELLLDNNRLIKLFDYNFATLSKLVTLNLSSNYIETIEDHTFQTLINLETLDLGYNRIKVFSRLLLQKNTNLESLFLSYNELQYLEARSFEDKNITEFYVHGNSFTCIVKDTFRGIFVRELNLSGGKITTLSDEAFSALRFDILTLNLSSNSISNVSDSAFSSLGLLTRLDLSNNNLQYLNFETNDLRNLSILYARNNSISGLNKEMFKYLTSLIELDLSFNSLREIELNAFAELKFLKLLILKQNILNNVLEANSFRGLLALERIEVMNTRTASYRDQAFSGMTHLQIVNSSFGQLSDIAYNAFKDTGSLEVLDLSHNLLEIFLINTTAIIQIKEIYLNNNLFKNITNDMFVNLSSMRKLSLANNYILNIQSLAFHSLSVLLNLDLASNSNLEISENLFGNLTSLSVVSLENIKKQFSFQYSDAPIKVLELSLCDIRDVNNVFIFKVKTLNKLNLSRNKLTFIDKVSFQSMPSLYWLDLSSNMITSIQPGSFLYLNMLNTLNLAANDIPSLQFGVFDGLHNLRELNLSRNAIHSFDAHILHNTPYVSTLSLDFNDIDGLSFTDFSETKITKLSIGGNLVPCEVLAKLKKNNFTKFIITADTLVYNSENVNGVSCGTTFNINKNIISPVTNNTNYEMTSTFEYFSKVVDKLRVSIENIGNRPVTNNNDDLKADLKSIVKSLNTFVLKSNKSVAEEHYLADIKSLLYCIAICTSIILIVYLSNVIYQFIKKRGYVYGRYFDSSQHNVLNSMELE